jgi:hypothetical protein
MIRHAGLFLTAATPVLPLAVAMIELPFRALLVPSVGPLPLFPAGFFAASNAAVAVSTITVRTDEEHRLTPQAHSLPENRFAMNRRHAPSQAGIKLDNSGDFVAG